MRRGLRWLLRAFIAALAATVTGFFVIAGFAAWLLWHGPVSLDPIAPLIAAALTRGTDVSATIDHTLLSLNSGGRIGILARGVHLRRGGGGAVLTLGELNLVFSARAALMGTIAPTRIAVTRPNLQLVRDADGSFHLGIGALAPSAAEEWGAKLIGDLVRPPRGNGVLGELKQISIEHASLAVDDRSLGVTWRAEDVDLSLSRAAASTTGKFSITTGQQRFSGNYIYTTADDNLVVRLDFADLKPALWAKAAPSLAGLAALDVPFTGEVIAVVDGKRLRLRDATWDVRVGAGEIRYPAFAGGALAVAGARMQGGYDPAHRQLNIGALTIALTHGTIGVSGAIDGAGAELLSGARPRTFALRLSVAAQGLKLGDFPALWPAGVAAGTRLWVIRHLRGGTLSRLQAQLDLDLDLAPDAQKRAVVRRLDGTLAFDGVSVEALPRLPVLRGLSGTARFDRTEADFTAAGGEIGGIKASGAAVRLVRLDTDDKQAQIEIAASGPLADALELLGAAQPHFDRAVGIDPKGVAGNFSAKLDAAFPIAPDVSLDQVNYSATATLTGVGIPDALLDRDLSNGKLTLKVDRTAAEAKGTAQLAGVPIAIAWHQALLPEAKIRTRYDIEARIDAAQRRALGLAMFDRYITGPVRIAVSYSIGAGANPNAEANATLDLADSALALPLLGWSKPAGVPATARLTLDLAGGRLVALRHASLVGGGMNAAFTARFDGDRVSRVDVDRLVVGQTDLHGSFAIGAKGRWTITANGNSLDAAGLIKELEKWPPPPVPPLRINAHLARLIAGPGRQASNVSAVLASDGPHWTEAAIALGLGGKSEAQVNFGGALGPRQFALRTNDFGALLRFLDVYDNVRGGRFSLTGRAEDRSGERILMTEASGSDYRVVGAPALARLLSLASLSGIGALLSGEGIPFSRIAGQVVFAGELISLKGMHAYGGALGINASGNIDRKTGAMDVTGTLVPAYTLNSVLGDIPVLGNLLVGGAGQGIFAANFRVYGQRDNPQISVNPLSTLAPGVLRRLFLFSPAGP